MPLPLLALAATSLLPQVFKGISGANQLAKANQVQVQDTTPAAFKENLALLRQDANNPLMPGYGLAQNQLAQGQANTVGQALRVGSSSGSVLGALAAADARRQQGMASLNAQSQQYQQQARRSLSAGLAQQAQYQNNDLQTANRTKAALKQAGNTNLFGALEGAASTAAYFGSQAGQNTINGVPSVSPLLSNPYDSTPLSRAAYRGYA